MVAEMGTVSLESDVFEMIRMITAKNATGACKKLQTLLRLQQEPIPITAAMIGSYVDLNSLLAQHVEQPGQADGDAHAGQLLVGVVFRLSLIHI